jgi:Beta-lactamase
MHCPPSASSVDAQYLATKVDLTFARRAAYHSRLPGWRCLTASRLVRQPKKHRGGRRMRRFMHGSIIALGLALALQQPSFAQAPAAVTQLRSGVEQGKLAGVTGWLKADVDRGRIPGAVVLIAQDGKILLHEAVGWADKDKKVAMKLDSIHPIASSTKLITTIAALRLFEENKISLMTPIASYLPELKDLKVGGETGMVAPTRPPTAPASPISSFRRTRCATATASLASTASTT